MSVELISDCGGGRDLGRADPDQQSRAAAGRSMKRALLTAGLLLALPAGVAAQSAPDLVVLGPNVSKSSLETGVTFWFIATVVNDGYG